MQIAWEEANKVTSPDEATQWIRTHVSQINQDIYRYAQEHEECKGMGTTVVLALCADTFCAIGNIGDSRCYISNEYGFQQVTEDHSLVNELVKMVKSQKKMLNIIREKYLIASTRYRRKC